MSDKCETTEKPRQRQAQNSRDLELVRNVLGYFFLTQKARLAELFRKGFGKDLGLLIILYDVY